MAGARNVGDQLHAEFAEYLLLLLRNAREYHRGDATKFDLDAATMGVIRAFLKDSEITFAPAEQGVLDSLRAQFAADRQKAAESLVSAARVDLGTMQ